MFKEIFNDGLIVNSIMAGSTVILLHLGIREEVFYALTILLLIDFITGIIASYKIGEKITSRELKIGALTKLSTILLVFTLALTGKILTVEYEYFLYGGIIVLTLGEVYSIFANVHCINTGERLEELAVTSKIAYWIRDIINSILTRKE